MRNYLLVVMLFVSAAAFGQTSVGPVDVRTLGASVAVAPYAATGTPASRAPVDRSVDVRNALDYGALGGSPGGLTLISKYGGTVTASMATFAAQTINSSTPYAWMTNSLFGLTFSMATSAAQGSPGTTLTFLQSLSGIPAWAASVATWQNPNNGNYMVQPGMQVSGGCIAGGTTVSTVNRTPGAGYGTIVLSQSTSSACTSGASITFTISPAQFQGLTVDWLGIQSAMAAAWAVPSGGQVFIPAGSYTLNHTLVNAGTGGTDVNNIDMGGAGPEETRLIWIADAADTCGILSMNRGNGTSASSYHDFKMFGPASTRVYGSFGASLDGLCMGSSERASRLNIGGGFRAGVNGAADHWGMTEVASHDNGYGVYLAPYVQKMGNQYFVNCNILGNTVASFGIAASDQIDASTFFNVHTGFGPRGFYSEAVPSNQTSSGGAMLTNSSLNNVWAEAVGYAWFDGTSGNGQVSGNIFTGGLSLDVGIQTQYGLPNGSGGSLPALAAINVPAFTGNTMIGTGWGNSGALTTAVINSSGLILNNVWVGDQAIPLAGNASVPALKAPNTGQNTFQYSNAAGMFLTSTGTQPAGSAVAQVNGFQATPFTNGSAFAGFTLTASVSGQAVAVASSGQQLFVTKAVAAQAIPSGMPVFPTVGGIVGGLDNVGAVGVSTNGATSGSTSAWINVVPGMGMGSHSSAITLTATGATQGGAFPVASATNQFSSVPSGTGALLALVPVGETVTIYNDGANALLVYPQSGGAINALATNAGFSVAAGAKATFQMISATKWHS